MRKHELRKLRTLKATPKMMKMAAEDTPKRETYSYGWNSHVRTVYQYGLYMRCQTLSGFLKVAFFLPDRMRLGGNLPAYELFICRQTGEFLTYDRNRDKWLTAKLDLLDWPDYVGTSVKKWINPEGYSTIKTYLGVKHGGFSGLMEYQLKVRADELKRRHKRETDPWDLDLAQTPDLPKDWIRWVRKVGISENYIFYQYTRKGAEIGYCTYCEKDVPVKNPRHNKKGRCLCCRHEITFKSVGKAGTVRTGDKYIYLLQRCEDGFMVREFIGSGCYRTGEYKNPEYSHRELRRAIYDRNGHSLRAYYWGDYKHSEFRWIATNVCGTSFGWCDYAGRVYGKTLPDLNKNELKRTGLVETIRGIDEIDPEKYLAVLEKVPQMEQLAKAGLPLLVKECVANHHSFEEYFKKHGAGNLAKMLGTDAQGLKRLRKNKGGQQFLRWLQYEKATGKPLPDHAISWFCSQEVKADDLKFIRDRMSIVQIYNYMRRQMRETRMSGKELLTTWADYLSMAQRFGMDTNDAIIYRVRKLRQRHDELVARCNQKELTLRAGEVLKEYPNIERIYESIRGIYAFTAEDYTVVVPSCIEEIMLEGEHLHHCVGGSERYWERIERKESYVLFLRRTSDLQKSYYTLEIEPDGTVRQKRTMYDRQESDIEDAKKFLKKWQKEISRRLTDEERELAKTSRVLREREFAQLRENQVVINTGHLRGHLLVDVLLADLMETKENTDMPALSAVA